VVNRSEHDSIFLSSIKDEEILEQLRVRGCDLTAESRITGIKNRETLLCNGVLNTFS
jgi:hypothetical protein